MAIGKHALNKYDRDTKHALSQEYPPARKTPTIARTLGALTYLTCQLIKILQCVAWCIISRDNLKNSMSNQRTNNYDPFNSRGRTPNKSSQAYFKSYTNESVTSSSPTGNLHWIAISCSVIVHSPLCMWKAWVYGLHHSTKGVLRCQYNWMNPMSTTSINLAWHQYIMI